MFTNHNVLRTRLAQLEVTIIGKMEREEYTELDSIGETKAQAAAIRMFCPWTGQILESMLSQKLCLIFILNMKR
jgi:hypothetical protein